MATTINVTVNGIKFTADTSQELALQVNGTTAMTINSSQVISFVNPPEGVAGLPPVTVSDTTTISAVAGNHYVLTAASLTTVTLPASPTISDTVWITVANGLTTNVIARNGQNINSLAEDMTVDNADAGVQLRFSNVTKGWIFS